MILCTAPLKNRTTERKRRYNLYEENSKQGKEAICRKKVIVLEELKEGAKRVRKTHKSCKNFFSVSKGALQLSEEVSASEGVHGCYRKG